MCCICGELGGGGGCEVWLWFLYGMIDWEVWQCGVWFDVFYDVGGELELVVYVVEGDYYCGVGVGCEDQLYWVVFVFDVEWVDFECWCGCCQ